jgi:hypothetical protein
MIRRYIYLLLFFVPVLVQAQFQEEASFLQRRRLIDAGLQVRKTGPYFGLQQGRYLVLEIGGERQWKRIQLLTAETHAMHMGFNYNFRYKVLGYDVGYWWKPSRLGLTYGANLFLRSDFDRTKVGIAPLVGYKIWLVHLQTGYHFMPRANEFETNTFFISLRLGIINDRDFQLKR